MSRPSWQDYFMSVVEAISQRSTCDRGRPGCVFVKNNQILATGYAGSPPGFEHCDEAGHEMEERTRYLEPEKPGTTVYISGWKLNEELQRFELPKSQHCVRTIHAEQNAILQAARRGISLEGSTCYVSMTPCRTCAMSLISVGVVEVVAKKLYQTSQESVKIFEKANIKLTHLEETQQEYSKENNG